MRKTALAILALSMFAFPACAGAQEADHSDRGDISDFRDHEDGRPEPYKYDLYGVAKPSLSLSMGVPVLFDNNPFWDADGSANARMIAPSVALHYTHPSFAAGWDFELGVSANADVFSRDPDELNEARLTVDAAVFHELGNAGTLSFTFRNRWSYIGKGLNEFDQEQQHYIVAFAPDISPDIWASVSAEYRDSSADSQRRFIGTANFDWTLLDNRNMRVGFFQELASSRFTGGTNEGRKDLLSLSELMVTPQLGLPDAMQVSLAATLFHRFSNREAFRFTAVQIGPALNFRF